MIEKKPLIFLHPLSKSLKQLHEMMDENAESEGVELYDLDSLEELSQLLPTIGPSIIVSSSPKKLAHTIQKQRKVINKFHSKLLLISAKALPRKVQIKLDKLGLNNIMTEPVPAKTIQYKISLLLKSIKTDKKEEESNTTFERDQQEEQESLSLKNNKTKKTLELDDADDEIPADDEDSFYQKKEKDNEEKELSFDEELYQRKLKAKENVEDIEELGNELLNEIKKSEDIYTYQDDEIAEEESSTQANEHEDQADENKVRGQKDKKPGHMRGNNQTDDLGGHMEGANDQNKQSSHYKGDIEQEHKEKGAMGGKGRSEHKAGSPLKGRFSQQQEVPEEQEENESFDLDLESGEEGPQKGSQAKEKDKANKNKYDNIDGHLKGNIKDTKKAAQKSQNENLNEDLPEDEEDENDDFNLDLEHSDDKEKAKKKEQQKNGGHYHGSIESNEFEEENDDDNASDFELDLAPGDKDSPSQKKDHNRKNGFLKGQLENEPSPEDEEESTEDFDLDLELDGNSDGKKNNESHKKPTLAKKTDGSPEREEKQSQNDQKNKSAHKAPHSNQNDPLSKGLSGQTQQQEKKDHKSRQAHNSETQDGNNSGETSTDHLEKYLGRKSIDHRPKDKDGHFDGHNAPPSKDPQGQYQTDQQNKPPHSGKGKTDHIEGYLGRKSKKEEAIDGMYRGGEHFKKKDSNGAFMDTSEESKRKKKDHYSDYLDDFNPEKKNKDIPQYERGEFEKEDPQQKQYGSESKDNTHSSGEEDEFSDEISNLKELKNDFQNKDEIDNYEENDGEHSSDEPSLEEDQKLEQRFIQKKYPPVSNGIEYIIEMARSYTTSRKDKVLSHYQYLLKTHFRSLHIIYAWQNGYQPFSDSLDSQAKIWWNQEKEKILEQASYDTSTWKTEYAKYHLLVTPYDFPQGKAINIVLSPTNLSDQDKKTIVFINQTLHGVLINHMTQIDQNSDRKEKSILSLFKKRQAS